MANEDTERQAACWHVSKVVQTDTDTTVSLSEASFDDAWPKEGDTLVLFGAAEDRLDRIATWCATWVNDAERVDPAKAYEFVQKVGSLARGEGGSS